MVEVFSTALKDKLMNREQFGFFLKKLRTAKENGLDVDSVVKEHENENVYFYNDSCIKKILASEKNIILTTDLINASLNLLGADRVAHPKLVNPFIPGELGYRNVEPDLLLREGILATVFLLKFSMKAIWFIETVLCFMCPVSSVTWFEKMIRLS